MLTFGFPFVLLNTILFLFHQSWGFWECRFSCTLTNAGDAVHHQAPVPEGDGEMERPDVLNVFDKILATCMPDERTCPRLSRA